MSNGIDNPKDNDNRNYNYNNSFYVRAEFPIISDWVEEGATVVDLGCGNGSLIKYIIDRKKVSIQGIEISPSGVANCENNNLSVKRGEIDKHEIYNNYKDDQFDYAVCNVTLQMVMYPEVLIQEMKRIAKNLIISFPNFAYFGNRLDLLFNGRMPRPMLHKYTWYNTGHIHQLSNQDFKSFCKNNSLKIIRQKHLGCFKWFARFWPNFFSKETVFLCEKI